MSIPSSDTSEWFLFDLSLIIERSSNWTFFLFPLFLVTLEDEDSATSDFSAALVILIAENSEVVRDLFCLGILKL